MIRIAAVWSAVIAMLLSIGGGAFADDAAPLNTSLSARLVSVGPAYLSSSQGLNVSVSVSSSAVTLSGVHASAAVTTEPLSSGSAIDAFLTNPGNVSTRTVGSAPLITYESGFDRSPGALEANRTGMIPLTIDPEALGFPFGESGVYGVIITAAADGAAPQTSAFVIAWVDQPLPQLRVSLVATVGGTQERTQALLNAAQDPRIALLVDPTALTLFPAEDAPDLAGRELFALPAGHIDISSLARAQADALLEFAVNRSTSSNTDPLPWIAVPASVDQATVDAVSNLRARAILAGSRIEGSLPAFTGPVANMHTDAGAAVPVIRAHERLSGALAGALGDDVTRPSRVVAESVLASLASQSGGPSSVVVAPGESWMVDGSRRSTSATALLDAPWVTSTSLSGVLSLTGREDVNANNWASEFRDVPAVSLNQIQQRVTKLRDLASASVAPELLLDGPIRTLLRTISITARNDREGRAQSIEAALNETSSILDAVRVTSSSEVTLVSNSGNVPVTVRNDLPSDVTVRIVMTSLSPNLRIDEQPIVTIPPGVEQTVLVPVTAIASDDVSVMVSIRTAEGSTLSVAKNLNVRVRAEWGNAVTGVFTALLVVLLVAGVWRTIRRGRRDTREAPTTELRAEPGE